MTVSVAHAVCRLVAAARDDRSDASLLHAFLRTADEAAFAELVQRHGPLVLGACQRLLGRSADAEDAFQATFLVLVRRARHMAWRDSLGPWLYGVAVRVARKARSARSRRAVIERQVSPVAPEPATFSPDPDDTAAILDEELAAVPEPYRRPLVLCELQGKSRKDAARELGLAEGTLSSRLARGREMLRARLTRRGVGPTVAGLAATVPAELATATAARAVAMASGVAGVVPAAILSLTEGVVKTMFVNGKLAVVTFAIGLGLTGFGAWNGVVQPSVIVAGEPPASTAPASKPGPQTTPAATKPSQLSPAPKQTAPDVTFTYSGPSAPTGWTAAVSPPPSMADPVATIFGNEAITRQEFAEYLIQRHGKKDLDLFVKKQIIARAFAKKGYTLTSADVKAAVDANLKAVGAGQQWFENEFLTKSGKTMQEWIEDAVIPQLMLARLSKDRAPAPTEQELRRAFDAKYGEKADIRIIKWARDQGDEARKVYEEVRADNEAFVRAAILQKDARLAANAGRVGPIARARLFDDGESVLALTVAKMKPGEVSQLIVTADGFLVIKCDRILPADPGRTFDGSKMEIHAEVVEAILNRDIKKLAADLMREANAKYHLTFPETGNPQMPASAPPPK